MLRLARSGMKVSWTGKKHYVVPENAVFLDKRVSSTYFHQGETQFLTNLDVPVGLFTISKCYKTYISRKTAIIIV